MRRFSAALENGRDVHPDVIRQRFNRLSSRLGHASVAFTLDVYSHALPGMDRDAAHEIASMFVDADQGEEEDDDLRVMSSFHAVSAVLLVLVGSDASRS